PAPSGMLHSPADPAQTAARRFHLASLRPVPAPYTRSRLPAGGEEKWPPTRPHSAASTPTVLEKAAVPLRPRTASTDAAAWLARADVRRKRACRWSAARRQASAPASARRIPPPSGNGSAEYPRTPAR